MSTMDTTRDREMILHPNCWPLAVLPLKKANPFQPGNTAVFAPFLSVTTIRDDEPIEIRIGTLYNKLSELPTKTYSDVDALLDDGWRVD